MSSITERMVSHKKRKNIAGSIARSDPLSSEHIHIDAHAHAILPHPTPRPDAPFRGEGIGDEVLAGPLPGVRLPPAIPPHGPAAGVTSSTW